MYITCRGKSIQVLFLARNVMYFYLPLIIMKSMPDSIL